MKYRIYNNKTHSYTNNYVYIVSNDATNKGLSENTIISKKISSSPKTISDMVLSAIPLPSETDPTIEHKLVGGISNLEFGIPSGKKGNTPIKGIDYWTNDDKNEIREYINIQLGVIENGSY